MAAEASINELLGACIFSLHPVVMFFDLNNPVGEINGQNRFETDIESQIRVEVGLELGFKFSLCEGLGWCRGGKDGIQVLKLNFPIYKDLIALG